MGHTGSESSPAGRPFGRRELDLLRRRVVCRQIASALGSLVVTGLGLAAVNLFWIWLVPGEILGYLWPLVMACGLAVLVAGAYRTGRRREQLPAEMGFVCPGCGLPFIDDRDQLLLDDGRCRGCGALVVTDAPDVGEREDTGR